MSSGTRVYVGRLPGDIREKDLERFFKGYGRLRDILMKNGYSFVEFDDPRDADDAVYELNGKELYGEKLLVEHARASRSRGGGGRGFGGRGGYDRYGGGRDRDRGYGGSRRGSSSGGRYGPPTRTDYRLRVENLSSRASWQDLKDHMRAAGEVSFADAHKQRVGEGVVEFTSSSDMKKALDKLDGTEINGKRIRLVEENKRSSRGRRSYTRSNSRSKSKSRSRSSSSDSRSKSPPPTKKRSRSQSNPDDD